MSKSNDDRCMTKAANTDKQAGITIYLLEELGDARLRMEQLKGYVKEALDIIERSPHRDTFFENAAHLLHGIPDSLFKMEKALNAAAMAGARIDYEEIKQTLKPEKADELESVLPDVRLRYLQRRSEEKPMTPKQAAEQLLAIADQTEANGEVPVAEIMTLLASVEEGQTKTAVDVKTRAGQIRNLAEIIKRDASKAKLATSLRTLIAATFQPTMAQVAASIYQTASSREQVMKGFAKANPHMSQEDLEKAADMWEKHKDSLKKATWVAPEGATHVVVIGQGGGGGGGSARTAASDQVDSSSELVSKFEEGKPADPTENMSEEDKATWWKKHQEHKDRFKEAASSGFIQALKPFVQAADRFSAEWERHSSEWVNTEIGYPKYLPSFDEFANDLQNWLDTAKSVSRDVSKTAAKKTFEQAKTEIFAALKADGWKIVENLKIPHATSKDNRFRLWFKAQAVYMSFSEDGRNRTNDMGGARSMHVDIRDVDGPGFLKEVERWEKTLKNSKEASTVAEVEAQTARFQEGKPADPTEHMDEEDKKDWWKHHDEHKDNFKEKSAAALTVNADPHQTWRQAGSKSWKKF